MRGRRPMTIPPWPLRPPLRETISFPRVYSTSTLMGAAYVMSRRRHCCGVMSSRIRSCSRLGFPTVMFMYRR